MGVRKTVTSKKEYYLLKGRGGGRRETIETFFAMKNMENGETNKNMGKSKYEGHRTVFASVIWLQATGIYSAALDVWRGLRKRVLANFWWPSVILDST